MAEHDKEKDTKTPAVQPASLSDFLMFGESLIKYYLRENGVEWNSAIKDHQSTYKRKLFFPSIGKAVLRFIYTEEEYLIKVLNASNFLCQGFPHYKHNPLLEWIADEFSAKSFHHFLLHCALICYTSLNHFQEGKIDFLDYACICIAGILYFRMWEFIEKHGGWSSFNGFIYHYNVEATLITTSEQMLKLPECYYNPS